MHPPIQYATALYCVNTVAAPIYTRCYCPLPTFRGQYICLEVEMDARNVSYIMQLLLYCIVVYESYRLIVCRSHIESVNESAYRPLRGRNLQLL